MKEPLLEKYYHLMSNLISKFYSVNIEHIRRQNNTTVDLLKKGVHRLVIYVFLKNPSVSPYECMTITDEEIWMTAIQNFLESREYEEKEEKTRKQQSARFVLIG